MATRINTQDLWAIGHIVINHDNNMEEYYTFVCDEFVVFTDKQNAIDEASTRNLDSFYKWQPVKLSYFLANSENYGLKFLDIDTDKLPE